MQPVGVIPLPLLQTQPDAGALLISLAVLLSTLLLATLLSPGKKSAFNGRVSESIQAAFNHHLIGLSTSPPTPSKVTEWLDKLLPEFFQLAAFQYGKTIGDRWHLSLDVHDGYHKTTSVIHLPDDEFPFGIDQIIQQDEVIWTRPIAGIKHDCVAIPLEFDNELFGIIAATIKAGFNLDPRALVALHQVASIASAALHRFNVQDELEQRATQLVLLGEISRRLISLKPLDERWHDILPLLSQTFNFAKVQIYDLQDGRPTLRATSHNSQDPFPAPEDIEPPEPVIECVASGQLADLHSGGDDNSVFHLALPLLVQDRLLGVFYIERAENINFSQEEIGLAEMLSAQMAIAALEAQNYAQQQEYNWYNTVMLEVTKHAAQPGDPDAAMRAVLQLTTMLAGASWTLLLLPDERGEDLVIGPSSGMPREFNQLADSTTFGRADFGLEPPFEESDTPYSLDLPDSLRRLLGDEPCLAMELSDGQALLGILLIGGTPPNRSRLDLLTGIAHQLSMRIENSRLIENLTTQRSLERELETARNIQRSFMPRSLPEMENWQVGATWLAAHQVGGDFFDFIPLPAEDNNPRWGVVIADVADKGVPAALFMALCRTLLRSIAPAAEDPAAALSRLNHLILTDTHADLFVSLFYAIWEPKDGRLSYANAGHNQPLMFSPNGSVQPLEGSGMVLGVSNRARYQTVERDFKPHEMLVMFTDGVTEAMNQDGVFFGKEGIITTIEPDMIESAQSIADKLSNAVNQFTTQLDPPDDLTTVVLKRVR